MICKDCEYWNKGNHDLCTIPNPGIPKDFNHPKISYKIDPKEYRAIHGKDQPSSLRELSAKAQFLFSRESTVIFWPRTSQEFVLGSPSKLNFDNECLLHSSLNKSKDELSELGDEPLKFRDEPFLYRMIKAWKIKLMLRRVRL